MLNRIDTKSAVRTCSFSYSGNMVAFSTDKQMGQPCLITIVDTRDFNTGVCYIIETIAKYKWLLVFRLSRFPLRYPLSWLILILIRSLKFIAHANVQFVNIKKIHKLN